MKFTMVLLIAACLHVSATGFGQKVSISGKDLPLEKVFTMIKKQTSYVFFYDYSIFQGARTVSLDLKDAEVEDVLRTCLQGQNLDFSITNKTISITRRSEKKSEGVGIGPEKTVNARGVVMTEAGQPLSGANITEKKSGRGTITNAKGVFEMTAVPANSVLIISFIGYASQQVTITDAEKVQVYLNVAKNELDKVVIQAYGTTTQRLATGNIATVSAAEIERQPILNPLLALQGKVAGLEVQQINGYASATIKVELRGRPNINNNFTSDPLYIIDGVPLTVLEVSNVNQNLYAGGSTGFLQAGMNGPAGGQSPFFGINPNDIESIEVLKDADATAIYGSRGANGVIIITTKKGKTGKNQFDLHVEEGATKVTRYYNLMNTQQYLSMRREALNNDGIAPSLANGDYDLLQWDTTKNTDWQRMLYGGIGRVINAQAGLSGGNSQTSFRIGAGYNHATNILTVSGADQRASVSINLSHATLNQRVRVSFSSQYSYTQSDMISIGGSGITIAPDAPSAIYDSLGNLNFDGWGGANTNARNAYPFSNLKQPYTAKTNFLNSSLNLTYQPLKGLNFGTNIGYNSSQSNNGTFQTIASQDPLSDPTGTAQYGISSNKNWIIEPQINYSSFLGKSSFNLLVGGTLQQTNTQGTYIGAYGYTSDLLIKSVAAANSTSSTNYAGEYKYSAVFSRITYNLENKYLINFTWRRDGSSRFGEGKQFGNFGSIGAAYIISEEPWIKKTLHFLSFAKLRGSYGLTGSDAVGDYGYLTRLSASGTQPYGGGNSLIPIQHSNPNYHWSTNKKLEAAIDLGFIKDRINVSVAYYRNRCGDQLVSYPTPAFSGFRNVTANSPALVQNDGLELIALAKIINGKNFTWSVNLNVAHNNNKLVAYPNFAFSPYVSQYVIGQPLNIVRLLHFTGVDSQTGQYTFEDKNHDGQITRSTSGPPQDDYVVSMNPKFSGGIGFNFGYKSFQLNLFFVFKKQIGLNALAQIANSAGSLGNQPAELYGKEWKKPGDITSVAKFTTQYSSQASLFTASDGYYTDASYIRMSNLSLSYAFPQSYMNKLGVKGCNIFLHTNDLFIITKYRGPDPETQNFGSMPPSKTIVAGINFSF